MRSTRKTLSTGLVLAVTMLITISISAMAEEPAKDNKIDFNALMNETQKASDKSDEIDSVSWMPEEYWRASLADGGDMTEKEIEEFVQVIRPYTLVMALKGTTDTLLGPNKYSPEAEVRSSLSIKDAQGNVYKPLSEDQVDPSAKTLIGIMKPIYENLLGDVGKHTYFYFFPAKDKKGEMIADPKKDGAFTIILGKNEYMWRLPLSSLVPPKTCSTCKEKLNGAFKFCPWDGTKL